MMLDVHAADEIRTRCVRAIIADPHVDPEALTDRCKVMVFAERFPKLGQYDDRISIVSPDGVWQWPGNTDPNRRGWNPGVGKYHAQLLPGVWPTRTGPHRGRPGHLRQMTDSEARLAVLERYFSDGRALGKYAVKRLEKDGGGKTEHGYFAINVHSGAESRVSSWGCITLAPEAWREFQPRLYLELSKHGQTWPDGWTVIVLVEG